MRDPIARSRFDSKVETEEKLEAFEARDRLEVKAIRSALVCAVGLAYATIAVARGWAVNSRLTHVSLAGENDRLKSEGALRLLAASAEISQVSLISHTAAASNTERDSLRIMRKAFTAALAVVFLQSACGSPSDCDSESCVENGGCTDSQACDDPNGESSDSASGTGGSGGMVAEAEILPTECTSEADCPATSTCSDGDDHALEHPPLPGMCVADCTADGDECSAFLDAVCVDSIAGGHCIQSCEIGTSNASKCGSREDMACHPSESGAGHCTAVCTDHDQCPEACSARTGLCTSGPLEPFEDFGEECDPESAESCSGTCVEVEEGYAVCSNPCVFASARPCAIDSEAPSLCAIATAGGSVGDVGYCAELCDCNDDCVHPEAVCDPFSDASVAELLGSQGVCAAPITADGTEREGIECAE